jgi:iron only hydrogenase large subunit-like protein
MSAILSADDLNDFISPGVACIKPVETLPVLPEQLDTSLEHEVIIDGHQPKATAPAQISLTDCLACSGCVTSAEAVLVSLQSHSEVLHALDVGPALQIKGPDVQGQYAVEGLEDESRFLYVASVSPQTRASLAAATGRGVSQREAGYMLEGLLRGANGLPAGGKWGNGFTWVVDTDAALEACLVLGSDEVLDAAQDSAALTKPILTSSCPGWVCYAEKTHPHVLPHLSKIKSPQALTGTLLKSVISRTVGIPPHRIWHLAVMPCFDKKLEASRGELTNAAWTSEAVQGPSVRDVDCVITSKEVLMLTESRKISFFDLSRAPPAQPQLPIPDARIHDFLFPRARRKKSNPAGGTSGGQLLHVLEDVCARNPGSRIVSSRGRNADVMDFAVESSSGEPLFRAARYYGFRNIQNLVRRLKPARQSRMPGARVLASTKKTGGLEYAYVEVMACPGGCSNGGGQLKADDQIILDRRAVIATSGADVQKEWLAEVDEAYFSSEESDASANVLPNDLHADKGARSAAVRDTLVHWATITSTNLSSLVMTSYREVISDVGKPKTTDTERVVQLAGKLGGGW